MISVYREGHFLEANCLLEKQRSCSGVRGVKQPNFQRIHACVCYFPPLSPALSKSPRYAQLWGHASELGSKQGADPAHPSLLRLLLDLGFEPNYS